MVMVSRVYVCVHAKSLQSRQTLCDPMDCACQAPLSMGFSRQEYWSGLPFLPPGDIPDPGIKATSPVFTGRFLTTEPPGNPSWVYTYQQIHQVGYINYVLFCTSTKLKKINQLLKRIKTILWTRSMKNLFLRTLKRILPVLVNSISTNFLGIFLKTLSIKGDIIRNKKKGKKWRTRRK